jgi:hypothetical protein
MKQERRSAAKLAAARGEPRPQLSRFSSLYQMLALDIVLPLIAVQAMLRAGQSPIAALSLAALFPLTDTLIGIVRSHRVGIIAGVSLAAILTGLGLAFFTGNAIFAILKDSAFTLVFAIVFLSSLLSSRPLVFRLNQQMVGTGTAAFFDRAWDEYPAVRRAFRLMTLVWGLGLLAEAGLRVIASLALPVATAAALSPWIAFVCIGGLILWTVRTGRAGAARLQQAAANDPAIRAGAHGGESDRPS